MSASTLTRTRFILATACVAMAILRVSIAAAHPLPGRDFLKFDQQPMRATAVDGAIFYGHDERSVIFGNHSTGQYGVDPNGVGQPGTFVADDFADNQSSDVVHVRWWGSYPQNQFGLAGVQKFLIAFESDVPAVAGSFSYPGQVLNSQVVDRGVLAPLSGTFTETLIPTPGSPENLYEYNAELARPFQEKKDTVYWLKIVALVDPTVDANAAIPIDWGWHTRDYTIQDTLASPVPVPGEFVQAVTTGGTPMWHFQDDAIHGQITSVNVPIPAGPPVALQQDLPTFFPLDYIVGVDYPGSSVPNVSLDLSFQLFTYNPPQFNGVPEPSTCTLLALGIAGVYCARKRRQ